MPSSISPTLAKMPIAVIDTQPDICAMRVAIRPAVAMSPARGGAAGPEQSVPPISTTGRHAGERHQPEAEGGRGGAEVDRRAAVAGEGVERRLVLVHAVAEELDRGDVGDACRRPARSPPPAPPRAPWSGRGCAACSGGSARRSCRARPASRAASQRSTPPTTAIAPMIAVTARPRVLTVSETASVIARAVCCCFCGDPAGEVVVEEGERLAEGVAVEPREHERIEVRAERQRVDRRAEAHQARAQHEEEERRRRASAGQLSAKSPLGPRDWARSISQPISAAAPTSVAPTAIETARPKPIAGKAPAQRPAHEPPEPVRRRPLGAGEGVDEVGKRVIGCEPAIRRGAQDARKSCPACPSDGARRCRACRFTA